MINRHVKILAIERNLPRSTAQLAWPFDPNRRDGRRRNHSLGVFASEIAFPAPASADAAQAQGDAFWPLIVARDTRRLREWGYGLIKHDYSTFDIFGRWGFQMGSALTRDGWSFAAGTSRTTAEVIDELYRTIRTAAGDTLLIGCNTVSHLSAGRFDICRIGDDTSGTEWARTRKMGVNSLAFNLIYRWTGHATPSFHRLAPAGNHDAGPLGRPWRRPEVRVLLAAQRSGTLRPRR